MECYYSFNFNINKLLRPFSMCAYALRVRVREKMGSYLSSLAISMCA